VLNIFGTQLMLRNFRLAEMWNDRGTDRSIETKTEDDTSRRGFQWKSN
jgi:hypothetical protein